MSEEKIVGPFSETSHARARLEKYCHHMGLDIGYGGDPIVAEAITMDRVDPYASVGTHEQNLRGSCEDLYWFKDGVLDYVYSSHLIEDFIKKDIIKILEEWVRVVKKNGFVVLHLPNQQRYEAYCAEHEWGVNLAHKEKDMSIEFMIDIIKTNFKGILKVEHSEDNTGAYSFDLVLKKIK